MFRKIFKYTSWTLLSGIALVVIINFWVILRTKSRIYTDAALAKKAPVGLVLGTSEKLANGKSNYFFTTRIKAAADLYKAGKVRKLIVSGDNSVQNYNETAAMRRALEQVGVPSRDIVEDFAGFRTLDSVVRTHSVFGQDSMVVISQRFHVQRALFIADAHGLKATGYIAEDPAHRGAYFKVLFREWFARVKAVLDCYLLGTKPKFSGPAEPIQF